MRDTLEQFSEPVRAWFRATLGTPTPTQSAGWGPIRRGDSTLLIAPTGSGKTLAAFLAALDQLMFQPALPHAEGVRVLYVSPLKALGNDIELNLRQPISGIVERSREMGVACRTPSVAIRSGDTPPAERVRFRKAPSEILITTPESLYLLLTSAARATLSFVESVIVDEVHALLPNKRGAHLALSLERLEALRKSRRPLQRIGLSATQRPVERAAQFLGGGKVEAPGLRPTPRPVQVVEVPSERKLVFVVKPDAVNQGAPEASREAGSATESFVWRGILEQLLGLIRAHRSTMIFVNNRSLAEKLSTRLNELAKAELSLAHHGSLSHKRRRDVESLLKRGELRAIVATSSLEMGIDIGSVDWVVQLETPASATSLLQRVGRSGHAVGRASKGAIFPKHRSELLSTAALVEAALDSAVEPSDFPRRPLDVLAQQIVALSVAEPIGVRQVFDLVRGAAPFFELELSTLHGLLDMLSGRYASDEFSMLKPRVVWDRQTDVIRARRGARQVAVMSGGTIPDRGMFGVFLSADEPTRVGELDEEMVFESRVGDVIVLGASSWRIDSITHDRVMVTPAAGEPGRAPFWRGEGLGRNAELGRRVGRMTRELAAMDAGQARARLTGQYGFEEPAAAHLVDYLEAQFEAARAVPSDELILVECLRDEVGDHRICLNSPFGATVHAPWAIAAELNYQRRTGQAVEAIWSDDGIVFRVADSARGLDLGGLFPDAEEVEALVTEYLPKSSLFATRFRENAGRALLLPKLSPGRRTPLWLQRRRAARLLDAASRHSDFPILLETYRECLNDVFDMPALVTLLRAVQDESVRIVRREVARPSPFSASLLFGYAGNFIYQGDAPLAERRAQALRLDPDELRRLLGAAELRQLLDADAVHAVERALSGLAHRPITHADALHDVLLGHGDLDRQELTRLSRRPELISEWLQALLRERRVVRVALAGKERYLAVEDAARYRDALGVTIPEHLPEALLAPVENPLGELVARYARLRGPFCSSDVAERFAIDETRVSEVLADLEAQGRIARGEYTPGVRHAEWCDREVLRLLKRRSLEALRRQIEPVSDERLAEFSLEWQRVVSPRQGDDSLFVTIEALQGLPLLFSELESEVLPRRVEGYARHELDELLSRGELVWRGIEAVGTKNGRIAFYPFASYPLLAPPPGEPRSELALRVLSLLGERGASFFSELQRETRAFPPDLVKALWELVWSGHVSNDTLAPLRGLGVEREPSRRRGQLRRQGRARVDPSVQGRWSRLPEVDGEPSVAQRRKAWSEVLLDRHGVLSREALQVEVVAGGFSSLYPVLAMLEERGRVRRGYFARGLSGQQFATPGAAEALRRTSHDDTAYLLSATDPANLYGGVLPWPACEPRPQRTRGAWVIVQRGRLLAYLGRGAKLIQTFADEPEVTASLITEQLCKARGNVIQIESIDGASPRSTALGGALEALGFHATERGHLRKTPFE